MFNYCKPRKISHGLEKSKNHVRRLMEDCGLAGHNINELEHRVYNTGHHRFFFKDDRKKLKA